MDKEKLIVIEGACDGIGKTTQYKELCDRLIRDGKDVANHHFPSYGTIQGGPVEMYLGGQLGETKDLSPYLIASLYAIDRAITWNNILKPLHEQGKTIVLDRYTTSSLFYQSALIEDLQKKKDFINYVLDYEYNKLGIKEPDSVIFLHAPFDLVTKMREARTNNEGIQNDIHEANIEFMKKVYENGMFLADYLSWDMVQCNDGDSLRSIEDIHEEVYRRVRK
jgi:dTMP kinase